MKYEVHSALSDDSNEGWVWIKLPQDTYLYKEIKDRRRVIRIKRKDAKPVYCEALLADPFYLKKWKEKGIDKFKNDSVIFISAWYRYLLRLSSDDIGKIIDLDVEPLDSGSLRELVALLYQYPRNHPQAVVRTASMMGIIGFGLGVIGIGLGILSIISTNIPGFVFCGVGFAITLLGIIGLIRRRQK